MEVVQGTSGKADKLLQSDSHPRQTYHGPKADLLPYAKQNFSFLSDLGVLICLLKAHNRLTHQAKIPIY